MLSSLFFSSLQDPVSINNRMNRIRDMILDDLINCSSEKLRPTDGRGEGRIVSHE